MKTCKVAITLIFLSFTGYTQNSDSGKNSFLKGIRIDYEQDHLLEFMGLAKLNSDRNYTLGAGIATMVRSGSWILPKKKKSINALLYPLDFAIQIVGFTPDNLRDSFPVIGDRPYSSVLMVRCISSYMDINENTFYSKGFYVGMMGLKNFAKNIQTKIHEGMNDGNTKPPYNPMGWHNQISNGGELTAMYSYHKTELVTDKQLNREINSGIKKDSWNKFILSRTMGYNIGYLTQASAAVTVKYGKLDLSNWAMDLSNNLHELPALTENEKQKNDYYKMPKQWELYFFANITPAISVYNGSLHGSLRSTKYRLPYMETGFLNCQAKTGFAWTNRVHSFAAFWAFKSPEMWNSFSRIHSWGGLSLAFYWE